MNRRALCQLLLTPLICIGSATAQESPPPATSAPATSAPATSAPATTAPAATAPAVAPAPVPSGPPRVRIQTTMGTFTVQLDPERAPLSVENFLTYVRAGHYDGTVFHRVIDNFVAQAGGYTADYKVKLPVRQPIVNESGNGLTNRRGTIAMARSEKPHSANSQFYLNLADNGDLDPLATRWGYAVFGTVVEGQDVVDRIGHVATGAVGDLTQDAPLRPIVIEKATVH